MGRKVLEIKVKDSLKTGDGVCKLISGALSIIWSAQVLVSLVSPWIRRPCSHFFPSLTTPILTRLVSLQLFPQVVTRVTSQLDHVVHGEAVSRFSGEVSLSNMLHLIFCDI